MSTAALATSDLTVEDLAARVGSIPFRRIRLDPPPGEVSEEDVQRIHREEGPLCEIINGVLVEKVGTDYTSCLTSQLCGLLGNWIKLRRWGWVLGPDGYVWLSQDNLRTPDISCVRRDQRLGGRLLRCGFADVAPALAVEVLSPGNTPGEMRQKRTDFFAAGTELFWIVDPERQEIEVWTDVDTHRTLRGDDLLDGGSVLAGFSVSLPDLFASLELDPPGDSKSGPA